MSVRQACETDLKCKRIERRIFIFMGKHNQSKQNNNSPTASHVTVKVTQHLPFTIQPSAAVTNFGTLACGPGTLFNNSSNLSNLSDMFRLFRINKVKFTLLPGMIQATVGSIIGFEPQILYLVSYGQTPPTTIADVEGPCGEPSAAFYRASGTVANDGQRDTNAYLTLKHKDFPILNTADPVGWLATQDDGSQIHFGNLYRVALAVGYDSGGTDISWYLRYELDVSFRDIVDPATIGRVLDISRNPNVTLMRGAMQGMVAAAQRVPLMISSKSTTDPLAKSKAVALLAEFSALVNQQ